MRKPVPRVPGGGAGGLRLPGGLAALAVAGLLGAGCGTGAGGPTVANLPGHHGATRPGYAPPTVAQSDREMVSFTRCMRTQGVAMSDPFHLAGHSGLSLDLPTRDSATAAAYRACEHFIQPIVQAKESAAASARLPPATLTALTGYAHCMRAHDIAMLDPTPQGSLNLGSVPGITDGFGRYTPQFRTADGACRHLLPRGIRDDGTGP